MADAQTDKLPKLHERLNRATSLHNSDSRLTCQWCSVPLPPGESVCPTCGSTGVGDDSMVAPADDAVSAQVSTAIEPKREDELVEWWKDEEEVDASTSRDDDPLPVILGLVGTAAICVILGVVVAPIALASVFENSLGIVVDDPGDLRPLGGILGLLVGAFISAIGMWVASPHR